MDFGAAMPPVEENSELLQQRAARFGSNKKEAAMELSTSSPNNRKRKAFNQIMDKFSEDSTG